MTTSPSSSPSRRFASSRLLLRSRSRRSRSTRTRPPPRLRRPRPPRPRRTRAVEPGAAGPAKGSIGDAKAAQIRTELAQLDVAMLGALNSSGVSTDRVLSSGDVPLGLLNDAAAANAAAGKGNIGGLNLAAVQAVTSPLAPAAVAVSPTSATRARARARPARARPRRSRVRPEAPPSVAPAWPAAAWPTPRPSSRAWQQASAVATTAASRKTRR